MQRSSTSRHDKIKTQKYSKKKVLTKLLSTIKAAPFRQVKTPIDYGDELIKSPYLALYQYLR